MREGLVVALWLVAVLLGSAISSWNTDLYGTSVLHRQTRGPAVLLDAFGEGKTLMARYMYFKAEIYHEVLDAQKVPHAKQKDAMPLLRMVTYLDPSLTETFDIIAWDLWRGWGKKDDALELLEEALLSNPSSHLLWFRHGFINFQHKQYKEALPSAINAAKFAGEKFERLNANRLKYWTANKLNDLENMREALDVLLEIYPGDVAFTRENKKLKQLEGESLIRTDPSDNPLEE